MSQTSSKSFPVAAVIGRWQLVHQGQMALIEEALKVAQTVVVVLGSSFQGRSLKNPFNWKERQTMLQAALSPQDRERIRYVPIRDYFDDARWTHAVRTSVQEVAQTSDIVLVGYEKDHSSYYLRQFPTWGKHFLTTKVRGLDATPLREAYFGDSSLRAAVDTLSPYVPLGVADFLLAWGRLPWRELLQDERKAIEDNSKVYRDLNNVAADAVVTARQEDKRYVLLVQRKGLVGTGQWAIPGGFVEKHETTLAAALRELREETGLSLWEPTVKDKELFDNPSRSVRSRIMSMAYFFELGSPSGSLPEVAPSEETLDVRWFDIDEELPTLVENLFEDHYLILERFLRLN